MWWMRASGWTPSAFRPRSLTTITPDAPSQIWLDVAAVSAPPSCSSFTPRMPSSVASKRMPSSHRVHLASCRRQLDLDRDDLLARTRPPWSRRSRAGGSRSANWSSCVLGQAVLLDDHFGARELAELDAGVARLHLRAHVGAEAVLGRQRGRAGPSARGSCSRRRRRSTMSIVPDITACAAKCSACCDEPHWRSTEVAGHALGQLRRQHRVARDVDRLFAGLADAAHDHVVDQRGIDAGPVDQRVRGPARPGRPDASRTAGRPCCRPRCGPLRRCMPLPCPVSVEGSLNRRCYQRTCRVRRGIGDVAAPQRAAAVRRRAT